MEIPDVDDSTEGIGQNPFALANDTTYTYSEILDLLTVHRDIILTVNPADIESIKQGLTVRKSKIKKRLKDQGIPVDDDYLDFSAYKSKAIPGAAEVRIKLLKRSAIRVLAVHVPDDL